MGIRQRRRGALGALLAALALLSLTACLHLPSSDEDSADTPDYGDVTGAIMTAVPRIVSVDEPERFLNGFAHVLTIWFETDSAEPLTADELDAVVSAIWSTLPWEPNTVSLNAGSTVSDDAVDLREAAAELSPLRVREAGQAGVTLTGMQERYGDWVKPE